jgi:RecG-like helicase
MFACPLSARECKYRELQDKAGQKMTITAKIEEIEPDEDDEKAVWVTLNNTATDHCYTFLSGVPKSALGGCKTGKTVTATGKVAERFDAWWGLEKVSAIKCD